MSRLASRRRWIGIGFLTAVGITSPMWGVKPSSADDKTPLPYSERERFQVGKAKVVARQYLQSRGPQPLRYAFVVTPEDEMDVYSVTLGIDEVATKTLRAKGEIGPDEQAFQLERIQGREHRSYGIFTKEPGYEQTKTVFFEIVSGKRKVEKAWFQRADGTIRPIQLPADPK